MLEHAREHGLVERHDQQRGAIQSVDRFGFLTFHVSPFRPDRSGRLLMIVAISRPSTFAIDASATVVAPMVSRTIGWLPISGSVSRQSPGSSAAIESAGISVR